MNSGSMFDAEVNNYDTYKDLPYQVVRFECCFDIMKLN
jgi:hypothetical protein